MQERTRARDAANKAIEAILPGFCCWLRDPSSLEWQAMRTAQERCKDELEKLADQRLQLRLAQAQVQQLKRV